MKKSHANVTNLKKKSQKSLKCDNQITAIVIRDEKYQHAHFWRNRWQTLSVRGFFVNMMSWCHFIRIFTVWLQLSLQFVLDMLVTAVFFWLCTHSIMRILFDLEDGYFFLFRNRRTPQNAQRPTDMEMKRFKVSFLTFALWRPCVLLKYKFKNICFV